MDEHLGAVHGEMAGDVGHAAAHPNEVELELDARRRRERLGQRKAELLEPLFDLTHRGER